MLTLFGVATGWWSLAVLPTIGLVLGSRLGWSDRWNGWMGVAIWLVILPAAHGKGILAPLVMVLAWLAVAIGPDRLSGWIAADWNGRDRPAPGPTGWIEDDLSVR